MRKLGERRFSADMETHIRTWVAIVVGVTTILIGAGIIGIFTKFDTMAEAMARLSNQLVAVQTELRLSNKDRFTGTEGAALKRRVRVVEVALADHLKASQVLVNKHLDVHRK